MISFIYSLLIIHSPYSNSKLFNACSQVVKHLDDSCFIQNLQLLKKRNQYFPFSLIEHIYVCQQTFEDAFHSLSKSHLSDSSIIYQCRSIVKQSNHFKKSQTLLINLFYCLMFDLKPLSSSQKTAIIHNLCFIRLICLVHYRTSSVKAGRSKKTVIQSQHLSILLSSYSFDQQKQLIEQTKSFFNPLGTLHTCCVQQFQHCVYQNISTHISSFFENNAYFVQEHRSSISKIDPVAPLVPIQNPQQLLAIDFLINPILFYAFYNIGFFFWVLEPFYKNALIKVEDKRLNEHIYQDQPIQIANNFEKNLPFFISYSVFCQLLKSSSTYSCEKVLHTALCKTSIKSSNRQDSGSIQPTLQLFKALNSLFHTPIYFIASECQLGLPFFDHRFDFLGYTVYQKQLIPIIIELKWNTLNYKHIQQIIHYTADLHLYIQRCKHKQKQPFQQNKDYPTVEKRLNEHTPQNIEINKNLFYQFDTICKNQSLSFAKPIGLLLIPHIPSFKPCDIRFLKRRIQPFQQNIIILQFQLHLESNKT